jgi:general nucleoside transport system ATP-binding protein
VLAAHAITKRFGRTLALDGVNFSAREGEIHALVGENGAGKSTLISVFGGLLRPDSGSVSLGDVVIGAGSAADALARGIAAVYQSPMLFERMGWEENLALGGFSPQYFNLGKVATDASALAEELGFTLPARGTIVERRTVAERVRLEILRALSFRPRVLILDEPTSVLSPAELQPFLQLLLRLRNQGRIVILVTHKLGEALAVADRITVLRHGRIVGERQGALTSEAELAQLMMGDIALPDSTIVTGLSRGVPIVELHKVTLRSRERLILNEISLWMTAGSIIGVAGVDGNGQAELVEVIAGVRAATGGAVKLHNLPADAGDAVAVIPQNRDIDGLILDLPLWENLLLSRGLRRQLGIRHGWIRRSHAAHLCRELIERFTVRGGEPSSVAGSLSGGNRQRFIVARALAGRPAAIVAHDICRGLDLSAAAELRERLREYAAQGGAVLLISSDLEELLALCHELYVINRGCLIKIPAAQYDLVEIGLLMSGATPTPRPAPAEPSNRVGESRIRK